MLTYDQGAVDTAMGNAEGWADFKVKTPQQGVATYVHAAFDPELGGKVAAVIHMTRKSILANLAL